MDEMMFCYQCEQAANCTACTGKAGVCGKSAETADAQDRLTGALIGFATLLLDIGKPIQPPQALLLLEGLFTTITNVNFDPETVAQLPHTMETRDFLCEQFNEMGTFAAQHGTSVIFEPLNRKECFYLRH